MSYGFYLIFISVFFTCYQLTQVRFLIQIRVKKLKSIFNVLQNKSNQDLPCQIKDVKILQNRNKQKFHTLLKYQLSNRKYFNLSVEFNSKSK